MGYYNDTEIGNMNKTESIEERNAKEITLFSFVFALVYFISFVILFGLIYLLDKFFL